MTFAPRLTSCFAVAALVAASCERRRTEVGPRRTAAAPIATYQSEVHEDIGAAVMILFDTSGSMNQPVPGGTTAKFPVAKRAVLEMVDRTEAFRKKAPDFAIKIGLAHFASGAKIVRSMGDYDGPELAAAIERIPQPGGHTAIGRAMDLARRELYRSGVFRKYIIVVTDGKNTKGPEPQDVAREIHERSEGSVQLYFVAFDTDPAKFAFLEDVGGEVVGANDAIELQNALKDIYEGKILAEAADYGEPALPASRSGR
jgi:Mg-chelatase subunit ChlD